MFAVRARCFSLGASILVLWAAAGCERGDRLRARFGLEASWLGLEEGWALVSGRSGGLLAEIPRERWHAWEIIEVPEEPGLGREIRYRAASQLVEGRSYWVYFAPADALGAPAGRPPPKLDGHLGPGHFVEVQGQVPATALASSSVFRWDLDEQEPVPLDMTESLEPGVVYWVGGFAAGALHGDTETSSVSVWRDETPMVRGIDGEPDPFVLALDGSSPGRAGDEEDMFFGGEPFVAKLPPQPPRGLVGWADQKAAHLRWTAPRSLKNGQKIPPGVKLRYRVVRTLGDASSEAPVDLVTVHTAYDGVLPPGGPEPKAPGVATLESASREVRFYVTALLRSEDGSVLESDRSSDVVLAPSTSVTPSSGDVFEPPNVVTAGVNTAQRPAVAIAQAESGVYAHLVYIRRGHGEVADQIHYVQSDRFGKQRTWSAPKPLAESNAMRRISEVAVAARKEQVIAVWLERPRASSLQADESFVQVVTSEDGGKTFRSTPIILRASKGWKRGVDAGIDRLGHSHVVWGEENRVYYVKDLQGVPQNVFDETKRRVNDEVITYGRGYADPNCEGDLCACAIPVEERYSLALEPDPENGGLPFGLYLLRTERAYVENPSLEVDDDKVSIVARQTRLYNHLPVQNPDWTAVQGPYVAPPEGLGSNHGCLPIGAIARPLGFRHAWKKDPYACTPFPPQDEEQRVARELRDPVYTNGFTMAEDFYSYNGDEPHSRDWYGYLYEGTWDERDHIKVAQRPVEDGAWSKEQKEERLVPRVIGNLVRMVPQEVAVETGWRRGAWINDTLQAWRIGTVDTVLSYGDEARGCDEPAASFHPSLAMGPSYPRIVSASDGTLVVVYEKGPSDDPNAAHNNPIYLSYLGAGHEAWSAPVKIGTGYLPDLSVAPDGTFAVVYYEAGPGAGEVRVVRGRLNALDVEGRPPAPLDGHGSHSTEGYNDFVVTTVSRAPPSPVHAETHGPDADELWGVPRIVSHDALFLATWVAFSPDRQGRHVVTARALAPGQRQSRLVMTAQQRVVAHQAAPVVLECVDQFYMLSDACGPPASASTSLSGAALGTGTTSQLGSAPPWGATKTGDSDSGKQATSASGTDGASGSSPKTAVSSGVVAPTQVIWTEFSEQGQPAAPFWAALSDDFLASGLAMVPMPDSDVVPAALVDAPNAGGNYRRALRLRDELYSARLGTQREYQGDVQESDSAYLARFDRVWAYTQGIALAQFARQRDARASKVADFLCRTAQTGHDGEGRAAILGWPFSWNTAGDTWKDARLVTGANAWAVHGIGSFLTSKSFSRLSDSDSRSRIVACYLDALRGLETHRFSGLVTAGYTADGLKHATKPHVLGLEEDAGIEWAYYDVLDAIGYDRLDQENRPKVARCRRIDDDTCIPIADRVLTEAEFAVLKKRVLAKNVVTEHNLDVLSVLNHALTHQTEITRWLSPEERGLFEGLKAWRDVLREAIFNKLWLPEERRFLTGGQFAGAEFQASRHTAIDNCSWLSLSVDYDTLGATERAQIGDCLETTVEAFVKELPFQGRTYRGTHYFPNSFSDPYIRESDEHEKLYHLEATAGLILGIRKFVTAVPDHPKQKMLQEEARVLWSEMHTFVRDNGFPYSTRRIQDLMTMLESSTAAIWYIDVFDDHQEQDESLDRPLQNYARGVNYARYAAMLRASGEMLRSRIYSFESDDERAVSTGLLVSDVARGSEETLPVNSVTVIEDQALAILAGPSMPERSSDHARWIEGLMSTAHLIPDGEERFRQFPFAAWSATGTPLGSYYQVGPQFLSVYAVSRQLARSANNPSGTVLETLADVVRATRALYGVGGEEGLFLSGGGNPAQVAPYLGLSQDMADSMVPGARFPRFRLLSLQDHVYAAFALRELLLAWRGDADTYNFLQQELAGVREATSEHFWDSSGDGKPVSFLWLQDDGGVGPLPREAAPEDKMAAAALYVLYGLAFGDPQDFGRTERALELLLQGWHQPVPMLTPHSVRRDFSEMLLFRALALRAGASMDPRLEQLAFLELDAWADTEAPGVPFWAGLLLMENPAGVFDVYAGPMTFGDADLAMSAAPAGGFLTPEVSDMLSRHYAESLAALLMSGNQADIFDSLLHRLILLDSVFAFSQDLVPISRWPEAFREVPYEERVLEAVYHLENLCARPPPTLQNKDIAKVLGADCEVASHALTKLVLQRIGSNDPASLAMEMEHLDDVFELLAWGRRVMLLSAGNDHPVAARLYAPPTFAASEAETRDAASGSLEGNGRALRRFINRHYAGSLPALAKAVGLSVPAVHLMLRTGKLSEEAFELMAQAAKLGPEEVQDAKSHFEFILGDSPAFDVDSRGVAAPDMFARHYVLKSPDALPFDESKAFGSTSMSLQSPFFRSKPATHALRTLAKKLDEFLGLPPEFATFATVVPALSYAASLGLEIDPGLLTIFVGREAPKTHLWEPVGRVRAQDLVAPFGTQLREEDDIRAHVSIFTAGEGGPLSGPTVAFGDGKIYHITLDWFGVENSFFGAYGTLELEEDQLLEVHVLRTDFTRSELIDASVRSHHRWKKAIEWVSIFPEPLQSTFLFWVELSIRGEFSQEGAERLADDPALDDVGNGVQTVRADGGQGSDSAAPEVRVLAFDPLLNHFPIESNIQFVADQILVFYCSQDSKILDEIKPGSRQSDLWAREGKLAYVAIVDRNRRQLERKKGLNPLEMGVFPFHVFDIDCRYVVRSLRKRDLAQLRDWAVALRGFLNSLSVGAFAALEEDGRITWRRILEAFRMSLPKGYLFTAHPAIVDEFRKDFYQASGRLPDLIEILDRRIEGIPLDEQLTETKLPPFRLPTTFVNLKARFDALMNRVVVSLEHPLEGDSADIAVAIYKTRKGRPGDYIEYLFFSSGDGLLYPKVWNPDWVKPEDAALFHESRDGIDVRLGLASRKKTVTIAHALGLARDGHTKTSTPKSIAITDSPWIKSEIGKKTLLEFLKDLDDDDELWVTAEIVPIRRTKSEDAEEVLGDLLAEVAGALADTLDYKGSGKPPPDKGRFLFERKPAVYTESVPIEGLPSPVDGRSQSSE